MIDENERLSDYACEETDGAGDAAAAALEVAEAAELEGAEVWVWMGYVSGMGIVRERRREGEARTMSSEEGVEGLCQYVDYAGQILPSPVKPFHLFEHKCRIA